jgi:integrase
MARGAKKAFTVDELKRIRELVAPSLFQSSIFSVGLDTMARAGELLAIRVADVMNEQGGIRQTFVISQRKVGGRSVTVSLTPRTQEVLAAYIQEAGIRDQAKLFPICVRTLQRMCQSWARSLGHDGREYGSHSLRKTKAQAIYQATKDVRAVQILLGHSWLSSTQAYIGGSVEESIKLALEFDI